MACGKSTIGKKIATFLNMNFVDMDNYLESSYGKKIKNIFVEEGEKKFRQLEHIYLKKLLKIENVVIATGGGTPCFYNNMKLIKENSISVYLKTSIETLFNRLKKQKKHRPLIMNLNDKQLFDYIKNSLKTREYFYKQANIIMENCNNDKIKSFAQFLFKNYK